MDPVLANDIGLNAARIAQSQGQSGEDQVRAAIQAVLYAVRSGVEPQHFPFRRRGHLCVLERPSGRRWYAVDGEEITKGSGPDDRPCTKCGECPTAEGYDPCIGAVPLATSACCGHGAEQAHLHLIGTMAEIQRIADVLRANAW